MEQPTNTTGTSGGDSGTIKIVSSLPRTGLSKSQTDDIVDGIKLSLDEHSNKAGNFTITYEDMDDATAQAGRTKIWTMLLPRLANGTLPLRQVTPRRQQTMPT
jgi:hypothetical protein